MSDKLWLEKLFWFLLGVFVTSTLSLVYLQLMLWSEIFSVVLLLIISWKLLSIQKATQQIFIPQSKHYKYMQKIEKKRQKSDNDKYHYISDQIKYIESHWGYNRTQKRVIETFLAQQAYLNSYNRLNGSLLPQLIAMIEQCLKQEQRSCKRAVSKRIREMIELMKKELEKHNEQSREKLETTIEVYDHLLKESR